MMGWTDRHCRVFHRILTRGAVLYTEMATADAVLYGDPRRFLMRESCEGPVAFQLGGAEPGKLAAAARKVASYGYDEINLNAGCPSHRVQAGQFGACLMAKPRLVAECVQAMGEAAKIPITVKCRIAIDDADPATMLPTFARAVFDAGARTLIVHARKAWLKGLNPRDNRKRPPLDHEVVYRLKSEFPELEVVINGGIASLEDAVRHLRRVDGVMIGRAAYKGPSLLAHVDACLFGMGESAVGAREAIRIYAGYMRQELAQGVPLWVLTRPLLGLFRGLDGARGYRRLLSTEARRPGAGIELVMEAYEAMADDRLTAAAA